MLFPHYPLLKAPCSLLGCSPTTSKYLMFKNFAQSAHTFPSLYFLVQNLYGLRASYVLFYLQNSITSASQIAKESLVCYTNYIFICTIKQKKIEQKIHLGLLWALFPPQQEPVLLQWQAPKLWRQRPSQLWIIGKITSRMSRYKA